MNDTLIIELLSAIPKNHAARGMGALARIRLPRILHRAIVHWYASHYHVDLDECMGPIDRYRSLAEFFVRPLKPGLRPIDPSPDAVVSPVDGTVHTVGEVRDGCFLQAPGRRASVRALFESPIAHLPAPLVESPFSASRYEGGSFAVLYLSPRDYHRVHVPREGTLEAWRYLPGRLWPVFPAATGRIAELFGRNERLAFGFSTAAGALALVMVGAFGVGRITSPLVPVVSNVGQPARQQHPAESVEVARGVELGRFELGSTVILLAEPDRLEWTIRPGEIVRVGRPIARVRRP